MEAYARFHQDRVNLLIHLIMVPIFAGGTVLAIISLIAGHFPTAIAFAVAVPASLAIQGFGHAREKVPSEAFAGPGDFASRILKEQFYLFPRFVLTGAWSAAWRHGGGD